MSAGQKPAPPAAARLIEETISELHKAQRRLRDLQMKFNRGTEAWTALETVDDYIHNALGKLGD